MLWGRDRPFTGAKASVMRTGPDFHSSSEHTESIRYGKMLWEKWLRCISEFTLSSLLVTDPAAVDRAQSGTLYLPQWRYGGWSAGRFSGYYAAPGPFVALMHGWQEQSNAQSIAQGTFQRKLRPQEVGHILTSPQKRSIFLEDTFTQ